MLRSPRKFDTLIVLGILIFVTTLTLVNLPYGKFIWEAIAQDYGFSGGSSESVPPPPLVPNNPNVVQIDRSSLGTTLFFLRDGSIQIFNCSAGICDALFTGQPAELFDLGTEAGTEVLSKNIGIQTIRLFYLGLDSLGRKVFQVNIYENGLLVDDSLLIFVSPNGTMASARR